jgi:predicted nucleotidyltransferase
VSLSLEQGQFRVSSAAAFPSGANTPVQALHELRAALARRSYRALAHVLSSEARGDVERQASDLATGLEHPETLDIVVAGDRATVTTPGGHRVELVNESGVWKVRDFE